MAEGRYSSIRSGGRGAITWAEFALRPLARLEVGKVARVFWGKMSLVLAIPLLGISPGQSPRLSSPGLGAGSPAEGR